MGLNLHEAVRLVNERLNDPTRALDYEILRNRPADQQLEDSMLILALLLNRLQCAVRSGSHAHQVTLAALVESRGLAEELMGYELLSGSEQ